MTTSPRPDERASSEAHAWLARLQGEASPGDRGAFERWYEADPAHRQAYDRIAADWTDRYGLLAHTSIGRDRVGLPRRSARHRPFGYAFAAASLAILLVAGLLLVRPGAESAARAEIIATAVGEIRTITLVDKSRVTLDTASRIAVRYDDDERRVELQEGRARFAVRRGDARPFVVEADGGEVVASGTMFDVSLASTGATVALIEGEVEVQAAAPEGSSGGGIRLRAGERVLVRPQGLLQEVVPASEAELRWPTGMLEFLNTPLGQAVAQANRYSRDRIRVEDPNIAALRVTGTFRAGDTAALARSLAAAFSLRVEVTPRGDIFLRSAD